MGKKIFKETILENFLECYMNVLKLSPIQTFLLKKKQFFTSFKKYSLW